MTTISNLLVVVLLLAIRSQIGSAFVVPMSQASSCVVSDVKLSPIILSSGDADDNDTTEDNDASAKMSLEDKMKKWEATEDEMKGNTLGGVIPSGNRADSFDVGLYILFPFMVLSGFAFAFFPFIMDKIDVDSVGPPPMM